MAQLIRHEHHLANDTTLSEQLVRVSGLSERESLGDDRLELLLLKKAQQGNQILSKPCRPQPFQPLDAIGEHPFAARQKPTAGDIQRVNGDSMKAITTARSA